MIQPTKIVRGPTIKHNQDKRIKLGVAKILREFAKEMINCGEAMIKEGKLKEKDICLDEKVQGEVLLDLRRKLIAMNKKGMLGRENLENKIGVYAALIWFGRLRKQTQDKILEGL